MSKNRKDVPERLKWRLTDVFKDQKEFDDLLDAVSKKADLSGYEGKLSDEKTLLKVLKEMDEIDKDLEKLDVYAYMKKDLDARDSEAQALLSRVENVIVSYSASISYMTPELTALPDEYLQKIIANPDFKDYDYMLSCLLKKKKHVLSKETENALAMGGQMFGGFHDIFSMIDNADMPFPTIEVDGKPVKVTHGVYGLLLQSEDRSVREKAFKAYYGAYISLSNTIAATYIGNVNKDVFLAKVRKYDSCLEQALANEDVPLEVYENLLKCVRDGLPLMHRYIYDRKKAFGLDELRMYDIYAPLVKNSDLTLDYEEAFKLVKKGLAPLGEDYGKLLQTAHDEGWIDVEETDGKRSGAYSIGVYAISHPYVLLNYQPTVHDVFTIAHELGHAMHSYKSAAAQPKAKADYKIFVAEVASTVNEVLLLKYLLKNTENKDLKKYLCSYYMDMIRTTLFRQTMLAGVYGLLLQSEDRSVREKAFKAYYGAYISLSNTIAATYIGNVNKDVFLAKVRKYDSCLEQALANEDVPLEVYENLLKCVRDGLPLMHRYIYDRKKAFGLDELRMYDIYAPLVKNSDLTLDYEEAFKLVKKGLAPLGEDYGKLLQTAHDEGWIDVEETDGKRSGAYSIGVYAISHPYVLLNYQPTVHDVFTIAHELGHAMHSYKSAAAQPKAKADYKIFVAEVASTVNEVLLLKYLLKNTENKDLKKYLCSYYMDMIRTTLFRQTMLAEFEYIAHDAAEKGVPLTKDFLNSKYLELNKVYYGDGIVSDDEIAYEWARIPHFYTSFYVYKYATGIISAISIAEGIYNEGDKAVEDYFKFLSSGGSDSPVELLKLAGVDLTKKDAFEAAMKSFEETLEEFERI